MRSGRQGGVIVSPVAGMAPPPLEQTDPVAAELKRMLDERAAEAAKPLALGLHFDLPEEYHHADHGLGSTNIRALAKAPADYWFNSWMNPSRPEDKDTEARLFGRAMHKLVFEGEGMFARLYCRGPDQRGMTTAEKSKTTRASNEEAAAIGKVAIKADAYDRIVMTAATIKMNPDLATAFENGHAEVTFVWEVDGVRLKARYDYLKAVTKGGILVAGIGDLKSFANEREKPIEQACYDAICEWRYDVQAAHYVAGMAHVPAAIREGRVYGFRGEPRFLERLEQHKLVGWQWVWHQKTRAPTTFSMHLSPGSQFLEAGRYTGQRGIDNYREYHERFGEGMWIEIHPVREAEIERMPSWWAR